MYSFNASNKAPFGFISPMFSHATEMNAKKKDTNRKKKNCSD